MNFSLFLSSEFLGLLRIKADFKMMKKINSHFSIRLNLRLWQYWTGKCHHFRNKMNLVFLMPFPWKIAVKCMLVTNAEDFNFFRHILSSRDKLSPSTHLHHHMNSHSWTYSNAHYVPLSFAYTSGRDFSFGIPLSRALYCHMR